MSARAKFNIGQIIEHNKFGYRGVIYEVDPDFGLTNEWYEQVAKSKPPKDQPWYHVIVDNASYSTYVAEKHLIEANDLKQISNPEIPNYFASYQAGCYFPKYTIM